MDFVNKNVSTQVVFRHRAHKIASDITNKMLSSLRLGKLFNAVLLKNNEETSALLKLVEPYVTWGYPSINTIRELIFKHGFLSIDSKKVAIDSNKLIEDNLGESGIICIEDIVHELFNVTDNFDKIKQFLLPFKVYSWKCCFEFFHRKKFLFSAQSSERWMGEENWCQLCEGWRIW